MRSVIAATVLAAAALLGTAGAAAADPNPVGNGTQLDQGAFGSPAQADQGVGSLLGRTGLNSLLQR
ncbi:hypothetical protein ACZ90_45030 [Streptomyces albus subsp. albus]|nr:hypothetical protein ACZ90_45030 [Streptomyces albus subsp. albus]